MLCVLDQEGRPVTEDCVMNWWTTWSAEEDNLYGLNDLICNWSLESLSTWVEDHFFPGHVYPVTLLCEFDC